MMQAADFDIRDEKEFGAIVKPGSKIEKLSGGFRFVEGPVWIGKNGACSFAATSLPIR